MLRKAGYVLAAVGVTAFVVAFLRVVGGDVPSSCADAECLEGENVWLLVLPAAVFAFVGGILMISFGGRGSGRTLGPRTFAEVDSGMFAPSERDPSAAGEVRRPRWTRSWRNACLLVGSGELTLGILFGIGAVLNEEARGGFLLTCAILGLVGAVFLALGHRAALRDRLHELGIPGEARIAGVAQTGTLVNNNPYVKLDLVVAVPGHPPYEVRHGEVVPLVLLGRLAAGATLPVKVDPDRPSRLVIVWEAA